VDCTSISISMDRTMGTCARSRLQEDLKHIGIVHDDDGSTHRERTESILEDFRARNSGKQ